ncbi:hypothetical protein ACFWSF_36735 [Streptomyces sp. NPDC058611]|uniref:hypothetical protein n=1 Tax=unclassified Streptomyces TaxID=2593676 RepID=UPI003669EE22
MSARRPLLTALGATTLLAALWFVPSAGATAPGPGTGRSGAPDAANGSGPAATATTGTITGGAVPHAAGKPAPLLLADTGSVDTTPYLLGGTACLGLGAGFVVFSVRRSRTP